MARFSITEARARFCYQPIVKHSPYSERLAGKLMAEATLREGKVAAVPKAVDAVNTPRLRVTREVVLPMIDGGASIEEVAAGLGVSPATIRDRLRLWRPVRERPAPGAESIEDIAARVARETGLPVRAILGPARGVQPVVHARQRVMMLAADAGHHESFIATAIGRDRSTVLYGVAAARKRETEVSA